jgi:hypothetical protein
VHELLRAAKDSPLFTLSVAPYALLDTDLTIVAANPAYLRVTDRDRAELTGAYLFDAFPDNPHDPTATGVHDLSASLERVFRYGTADDMGVQRYDIPDRRAPSVFRHRTWTPVNSPLTAPDQRVVGVLHHVEDVTAVYDAINDATDGRLADRSTQPPGMVRDVIRAAARYARTAATGLLGPVATVSACLDRARRDALWHRITHSARTSRDGCAAAVAAAAVAHLTDIDAAVVTVRGTGLTQLQLAASHGWAQRAEELQLVTGEGPSHDAYRSGQPALVPDLNAADATWPAYADAAAGLGVSAVFAFPLCSAAATVGTLTLYRRDPERRFRGVPVDAEIIADIAATVILADSTSEIAEQISADADVRDLNVAVGVLASVQDVSTDDAHAQVRAAAYASGRRLAEVAREILARHLPSPDEHR